MAVTDWRRKRRIRSLVALFCTLAAFTVNVFDVREELGILSSGMDHDVMAGLMNSVAIEPVLLRTLCSVQPDGSVEVAPIDRLSNDFRAPPSLS